MKKVMILLLVCFSSVTQAQVFKCVDKAGKTNYQYKPCEVAAKEQHLQIKGDPTKETEGKAKYKVLQSEYEAKKAKQVRDEKPVILYNGLSQQQLQNQINANPGVIMPASPAPNQPAAQ